MSDLGGAVLLGTTGMLLWYVGDLVLPLNRPSIRLRWAVFALAGGVLAVAGIYGSFAYSVEVGSAARPWLKLVAGFLMGGSALLFRKAVSRER